MTKLILGVLIGAGIVFSWCAVVETEERKKISDYEKLVERMRKLP